VEFYLLAIKSPKIFPDEKFIIGGGIADWRVTEQIGLFCLCLLHRYTFPNTSSKYFGFELLCGPFQRRGEFPV
jgi:hypothetical protein